MAISNELLSTTLFSIRDSEVDALHQKVAFLDHWGKVGGVEREDGGIKIQRPIATAEHSSMTAHTTGYEPVNMAVSDVTQPAIYDWADFSAPIVITKKEELENQGEKAIVKILEARTRSVFGMFRRNINQQILKGDVVAAAALNTLYGHSTTSTNDGFLEGVAYATGGSNTVGGIAKSTAILGWNNIFGDAADDFSANGLAQMGSIYVACNSRAPAGDIKLILASEAAYNNYKQALFAAERYIDEKTLDGGRFSLAYGGAMVEPDIEMPTSGTADQEFSMYFLNPMGLKWVVHKDADFAVSPFESVSGTIARSACVYLKAQLCADHLASLGVLVDGNTN